MFFHIIIIICLVPFSFCQERPNQNVGQLRYRIKRVPEKTLEELHQLMRNNSNYHQTHKEKIMAVSVSQPVHPNVNSRPKLANNKVVKKTLVTPRAQLQKTAVMKQNIAKKPRLANNDEKKSTKATKETAHSKHKIIAEPLFIEDPVNDIILTDKPQSVKVNQKTISEIEKPMAIGHHEETDVLNDTSHTDENNSIDLKNNLHEIPVLPDKKIESVVYEERDQMIHRMKLHNSDANNDNVPLSATVSDDMKVQSKISIVDNTNKNNNSTLNNNIINETADVTGYRRKSDQNNGEQLTEDKQKKEELNLTKNTRRLLLPFTGKELKIVPISPPKTSHHVSNETSNKLPSKPGLKEIDDNTKKNNDVSGILKPLEDCMKNETFEVIEIKQRNVTEVIERQPPLIECKESSYSTPVWQLQTSNIRFEDSYKPEITYLPSPYKYPYSNPYNQDSSWCSIPNFDNSHRILNADALKKTWRSWVDTEVLIKTTKTPYEKHMQKVLFSQTPLKKGGENNQYNFVYENSKPTMYTSYPCYVHPNTGYTPTTYYYNS
ncbi:hypothetical protein evm_005429 [Chilo suppressalis]|nr:hypothetical protein evm_005429 [Chilo suppressalis]